MFFIVALLLISTLSAVCLPRVISRLFRARWPGAVAIGMCQALRDLDLGERQLRVAVSRVLRHLRKRAELHDLPPLTYQLLLLAGR